MERKPIRRLSIVILAIGISVTATSTRSIGQQSGEEPSPSKVKRVVPLFPVPSTVKPPGYIPSVSKAPSYVETFISALSNRIYSNWEPGNLPTDKLMEVQLSIRSDGSFSDIKLSKTSGDAQVDFSCIEAVAESSEFQKQVPEGVVNSAGVAIGLKAKESDHFFNCARDCPTPHVAGPENPIIWHLIPSDALNCVAGLDASVVHSERNLRFIKKDYGTSEEMNAARAEWTNFLRTNRHLNRRTLTTEAKHIEQKYAVMFDAKSH